MSTTLESHDIDIDVEWVEKYMLMLHKAPEVKCEAKHQIIWHHAGIKLSDGGPSDPCSVEVKWHARKHDHPNPEYRTGKLVCDNFRLGALLMDPTGWVFTAV